MRFHLRSLFVVVTVTAVMLAIATIATRDVRKRHRAESDLRSMGAHYVAFDENNDPSWVSFVEPIRSPKIAEYTSLRHLDLAGAKFDDASARHIAGLQRLEAIHLTDSGITDRQLDMLAQIGSLKILRLCGTGITDEAIDSIASINGLQAVDLSDTFVTDDGTERLKALRPDVTVRR